MPKNTKIKCVLIIGLGRIGLPQALSFAHAKIKVYGFDQNVEAVDALKAGKTPFFEPSMAKYLKATIHKTFFPHSSWPDLFKHLFEIDAIIFTISTGAPDESAIINEKELDFSSYFTLLDILFAKKTLLKKGIKLIVRTTLPLGGSDKLKECIETKYSLREGKDFYLAFVPERITEGCAIEELRTIPKIIGVYSDAAYGPIAKLFKTAGTKIIRVKNPITAEFCKLTDNSFRSTIFSYSNEIAMYASNFDIDVKEVIATVNNNYDRNFIPQPGFVSGYCLSKDPYIFASGYLKRMTGRDFQSVWFYGRKTNDYLVEFIAKKVLKQLKDPVNNCVAILGLAFKEDVDDFRISHSLKMIESLVQKKIKNIKVYDPYLDRNVYTTLSKEALFNISEKTNHLTPKFFANVDAIIVCNQHKALVDLNETKILTKLLQKTKKPCFLYDGFDIWKEAANVGHIHYEGFGFKLNSIW